MVNPPKPGDISHLKFVQESKAVLESLGRRAHIMTVGFNSCRNVVCNFTEGAMHSFPQICLSPKAIEAARKAGKGPDVFYCLKLLEATRIFTVPGSGVGQKEGVFHLRTTTYAWYGWLGSIWFKGQEKGNTNKRICCETNR